MGRNNRNRLSRIVAAGIVLALASLGRPVPAEEMSPAAATARTIWRIDTLGGTIVPESARSTDPLGILTLPHANADIRHPALQGNAGGRIDGEAGGVAVAGAYPTLYGVWSVGSGYYQDDDGTLWRGDLAAARPVGNRLRAGVSLTGLVASGDDGTDLGVGVNVGGSARIGGVAGLSGVTVHAALLHAGKTVRRFEDEVPVFPAFTPVVGLEFVPYRGDEVTFGVAGSVAFDRFRGISADLSGSLSFENGIRGTVGWWHRGGVGNDGVWPGMTLSVGIPLGNDGKTRGYVGGVPTRDGSAVAAGGVRTIFPPVDSAGPEISYRVISPEIGDGDGETTVLLGDSADNRQLYTSIAIEDIGGVRSLEVRLLDRNDTVVRRWEFVPRDAENNATTVQERITGPLFDTEFAGEIVWSSAEAPNDGFYRVVASGVDEYENRREAALFDVMVDTTPPDVRVDTVRVVNGSGSSREGTEVLRFDETYEVAFSVRDVDSVEAYVVDQADRRLVPLAPELAGSFTEDGFLRGSVTWDGRGETSGQIEEGVYRVVIVATDGLGNGRSVKTDDIVVERTAPEFKLLVDTRRVTPDGDGERDEATLSPTLAPIRGLREWRIAVVSVDTGEETGSWSGIDLPPRTIRLDASVFPVDGRYRVVGRSVYRNGSEATTETGEIIVDRIAPTIEIALSQQTVRPERGRDVDIYFEGDGTTDTARVLVSPVRSVGADEQFVLAEFDDIPESYRWNMTGTDGKPLEPGIYRVVVEAADRNGNRSVSAPVDVVLQERISGVGVVAGRRVISPNGDGTADEVSFTVEAPVVDGGTFTFEILDETDQPIRRFAGGTPLPDAIDWNGRDSSGLTVPDGLYRSRIELTLTDGSVVTGEGGVIEVDTTPPEASIAITGETVVSPDGDGRRDTLTVTSRTEGASAGWFVLPEEADARREAIVPPRANGTVQWTPERPDGGALPDGVYRLGVEVADSVGNARVITSERFRIDTRPVGGFVRIDRGAVNPDGGDDEPRYVTVEPVLLDPEGLETWSVTVINASTGERVFSREGTAAVEVEPFRWPADRSRRDASLRDGEYVVEFSGRYLHGPVLERRSPPIVVDTTPPELTVETTPRRFSPDGDGRNDLMNFDVAVTDASALRYWYLEIDDPRGAFFFDVGGEGDPPDRFRWDGRARNGERVLSAERYPWRFEVVDALGNRRVVTGEIAVDILVEPYGDGFRIQVPSITFPPNSAELVMGEDDARARQNERVITAVAEILRRFPEYTVIVEGHAVNISGTEREQREELIPLSRDRAEAVRDALIDEGVPAGMLRFRGRGGDVPIVDHSDEAMRWKNRRVDFILER